LPKKELIAGLSEAVKYGLIKDPTLYRWIARNTCKLLKRHPACLEHLVCHCADIKARVVSRDERDTKDIRIILNFGHTIGHAVEAASDFALSHGESVAIGMACACDISVALGLCDKNERDDVIGLLETIGLPTQLQKVPRPTLRAAGPRQEIQGGQKPFCAAQTHRRNTDRRECSVDVIREVETGRLS
jgi:3-dehydroquinate synthase